MNKYLEWLEGLILTEEVVLNSIETMSEEQSGQTG